MIYIEFKRNKKKQAASHIFISLVLTRTSLSFSEVSGIKVGSAEKKNFYYMGWMCPDTRV